MLGIYRLLSVSLFVCLQIFCNGYLRRGLTQSDKIWHDGRLEWATGHLYILVNFGFGPGISPKAIGQSRARCDKLVGDDTAVYAAYRTDRHVGIYASRDIWHWRRPTCCNCL